MRCYHDSEYVFFVYEFQDPYLSVSLLFLSSDGLILSTQASGIIFDPPTLDFEEQYATYIILAIQKS